MNKLGGSLGMCFQGFYKVAVVDKDGKEIWRQPNWGKNLILNQGMDGVMTSYSHALSYIGIAGIGDRTNSIFSGEATGSAINGEFFLTPGATGIMDFSSSIINGWSGSLQSGDMIKFADGTEVMATGSRPGRPIDNDYSASLLTSPTVASQSFTIYKTSATGLHREVKRAGTGIATSSYLSNGCGSAASIESASLMHWRTYDFGSESISRTYTEIGVGWSSVGWSSSSFARVLLPVPTTVLVDQRLRLIYGLLLTFSPTASIYTPNVPISGWPVAPSTNTNVTQSIQLFKIGSSGSLSYLDSDGIPVGSTAVGLEVPAASSNCYIWASSNSQPLRPFGVTPINRGSPASMSYHGSTINTYVPGTYECYKYATFTLNEMNIDQIWTIGFGGYENRGFSADYTSWSEDNCFCLRFDQPQTKLDTQTLTVFFKWSWGRILA